MSFEGLKIRTGLENWKALQEICDICLLFFKPSLPDSAINCLNFALFEDDAPVLNLICNVYVQNSLSSSYEQGFKPLHSLFGFVRCVALNNSYATATHFSKGGITAAIAYRRFAMTAQTDFV